MPQLQLQLQLNNGNQPQTKTQIFSAPVSREVKQFLLNEAARTGLSQKELIDRAVNALRQHAPRIHNAMPIRLWPMAGNFTSEEHREGILEGLDEAASLCEDNEEMRQAIRERMIDLCHEWDWDPDEFDLWNLIMTRCLLRRVSLRRHSRWSASFGRLKALTRKWLLCCFVVYIQFTFSTFTTLRGILNVGALIANSSIVKHTTWCNYFLISSSVILNLVRSNLIYLDSTEYNSPLVKIITLFIW